MGLLVGPFLCIFIPFFFVGCKCDLEAILTNSRLPDPTWGISSIYDGDDSIYIFGGIARRQVTNRIHRYQISSDSLSSQIANFPSGRFAGGISSDYRGNIFYYGNGYSGYRNVFKFDPTTLNLNEVQALKSEFVYGSAVTYSGSPGIAHLISSQSKTVECFNMYSARSCGQYNHTGQSIFAFNSAFVTDHRAFVFGQNTGGDILILDLISLESHVVSSALPDIAYPRVVTDGRYGYLIGGLESSLQNNSLIRFDPETLLGELFPVKNHPGVEDGRMFYHTSTVYVDKLNRIYIFGGASLMDTGEMTYYDEIWYIDLPTNSGPATTPTASTTWIPITTESNPDIFSCDGKPNGMYPSPSNCASYIGCYEGELFLYNCPAPLLFHPERERCDYPQEVECLAE